jgi:ankyrin repeat protein
VAKVILSFDAELSPDDHAEFSSALVAAMANPPFLIGSAQVLSLILQAGDTSRQPQTHSTSGLRATILLSDAKAAERLAHFSFQLLVVFHATEIHSALVGITYLGGESHSSHLSLYIVLPAVAGVLAMVVLSYFVLVNQQQRRRKAIALQSSVQDWDSEPTDVELLGLSEDFGPVPSPTSLSSSMSPLVSAPSAMTAHALDSPLDSSPSSFSSCAVVPSIAASTPFDRLLAALVLEDVPKFAFLVSQLVDLAERTAALAQTDAAGDTLLIIAVRLGNLQAVRLLLRLGAPVRVTSGSGHPVLVVACLHHPDEQIVQALLDRDNEVVNMADQTTGTTPLMCSAWDRSLRIMEQLLLAGAETRLTDAGGLTALHHAASRAQHAAVERLLMTRFPCCNTPDLAMLTPLHWAVAIDSTACAHEIARHRWTRFDLLTSQEENILHIAARHVCCCACSRE